MTMLTFERYPTCPLCAHPFGFHSPRENYKCDACNCKMQCAECCHLEHGEKPCDDCQCKQHTAFELRSPGSPPITLRDFIAALSLFSFNSQETLDSAVMITVQTDYDESKLSAVRFVIRDKKEKTIEILADN